MIILNTKLQMIKGFSKKLKNELKGVDTVWLASDEDREERLLHGIWLRTKSKWIKYQKIVFREMKNIKNNWNPRQINKSLVDAQQARRVIDRLVGYKISPILWKKLREDYQQEESNLCFWD